MNWYSFQFKFEFEQNTRPKWWLDILVIDTVVRDVMENHKNNIELWRFHRRADHDESGHKFTLWCYTTEEVSIVIDEIASCHKFEKMETPIKQLQPTPYSLRYAAASRRA